MKACPFCGNDAEIVELNNGKYTVICTNNRCNCESPNDSVSKKGAARIWNRRRPPLDTKKLVAMFYK